MSKDTLKRIFEPFYTTRSAGEGTGMGLSVVHGIVADCGGCITAYSEVGVGTTFHVFLPKVESSASQASVQEESLPTGTERILVVDDEEDLVDIAVLMLREMGYEVVGCVDSVKALETFSADPSAFDLVLTDTTMPKMTGDALLRAVHDIRPNVPAILCSGFSERVNSRVASEVGAHAFLTKPLTIQILANAVRAALDAE